MSVNRCLITKELLGATVLSSIAVKQNCESSIDKEDEMTTWKLWDIISEETKRELRALMPKTWRPPREDWGVKTDSQLEGIEEINHIIRRRPHHQARLKR